MKKIEKEELIKIFEDQIGGIQRLSHVSIPDLKRWERYPCFYIKINYGVSGADVLHPNTDIQLVVDTNSDDTKTYSIKTQLIDSVTISNEDGERLIEQLNSVVGELKKKNIIKN